MAAVATTSPSPATATTVVLRLTVVVVVVAFFSSARDDHSWSNCKVPSLNNFLAVLSLLVLSSSFGSTIFPWAMTSRSNSHVSKISSRQAAHALGSSTKCWNVRVKQQGRYPTTSRRYHVIGHPTWQAQPPSLLVSLCSCCGGGG